MEISLKDRAAIVTGGGRGIGQAVTLALGEAGADVAINYRKDEDSANETVEQAKGMGRKSFAFQADVTDYPRVEEMVAQGIDTFGKVDILVHAPVWPPEETSSPIPVFPRWSGC